MNVNEAEPVSPATNDSVFGTFCNNETILQNDQSDFSKMLTIFFLVFSVLSLLYGISTWIVLPNARSFQNYAYIQVVFVQSLRCCVYVARPRVSRFSLAADYLHYMFSLSFQCWLLMPTFCMYQEIVMSFLTFTHLFYSANLFAWGLPAVTILLSYVINSAAILCNGNRVILYYLMESVLLMMNVVCYARVVFSILKGYHVLTPSRTSHSVVKSTLTLLLGVMPAVLHFTSLSTNNVFVEFVLNLGFPSFVIIVWFVCLKSNLKMWFDWFRP